MLNNPPDEPYSQLPPRKKYGYDADRMCEKSAYHEFEPEVEALVSYTASPNEVDE